MATDKPLHVRVAEALGWTNPRVEEKTGLWVANVPGQHWGPSTIPRYDTSWKATGPLIEKHGLMLWKAGEHWGCETWPSVIGEGRHWFEEPTPLRAACFAILALGEAGKL